MSTSSVVPDQGSADEKFDRDSAPTPTSRKRKTAEEPSGVARRRSQRLVDMETKKEEEEKEIKKKEKEMKVEVVTLSSSDEDEEESETESDDVTPQGMRLLRLLAAIGAEQDKTAEMEREMKDKRRAMRRVATDEERMRERERRNEERLLETERVIKKQCKKVGRYMKRKEKMERLIEGETMRMERMEERKREVEVDAAVRGREALEQRMRNREMKRRVAVVVEEMAGVDAAEVGYLTEDEFWEPIKDEYVSKLASMSPEEVYPSPNPGPSNPDGSVNFECHCVGHLVASPCGWEFREAISCQKVATTEEDEGRCAEQLMTFMDCAIRTQCFKKNKDSEEKEEKKEQ